MCQLDVPIVQCLGGAHVPIRCTNCARSYLYIMELIALGHLMKIFLLDSVLILKINSCNIRDSSSTTLKKAFKISLSLL